MNGKWSLDHEKNFKIIKNAIQKLPTLKAIKFRSAKGSEIKTYLSTDASNNAVGSVLYQIVNKNNRKNNNNNDNSKTKIRYIGFYNKSLSKSQKNYAITKKELLGIVLSLLKWEKELSNLKFEIITDHNPLTQINTCKASDMIVRWMEVILKFNFTISHCPGIEHCLPDALSRIILDNKNTEDSSIIYGQTNSEKEGKKAKEKIREKKKKFEKK